MTAIATRSGRVSLSPEAMAFLGKPRVTVRPTRSVRLLTGGEADEDLASPAHPVLPTIPTFREDTMPKTSTTEAPKPKRKYTRRKAAAMPDPTIRSEVVETLLEPAKSTPDCVFSIDSTGALLIRRGDHGMEISAEEVDRLQSFMDTTKRLWHPESRPA